MSSREAMISRQGAFPRQMSRFAVASVGCPYFDDHLLGHLLRLPAPARDDGFDLPRTDLEARSLNQAGGDRRAGGSGPRRPGPAGSCRLARSEQADAAECHVASRVRRVTPRPISSTAWGRCLISISSTSNARRLGSAASLPGWVASSEANTGRGAKPSPSCGNKVTRRRVMSRGARFGVVTLTPSRR